MHPTRPPLLTVRVLAWRARHALVALGCAGALLVCARALAPPPPPTVDVAVTARAVPAGRAFDDADLRTVAWPVHLAPADVLPVADAYGRAGVVDLPAGVPLLAALLAGDRYDVEAPAGTVVVPVRLADPAVTALLRPGDRVDLVRPGDGGPVEVVARSALVLRTEHAAEGGAGPLGLGGAAESAHAVVAVGPAEGRALAAAAAWGELGAVLVSG